MKRIVIIGIRMAIGARPGGVLLQFLVEGMVLSLLGSAVGVFFGCWPARKAAGLDPIAASWYE